MCCLIDNNIRHSNDMVCICKDGCYYYPTIHRQVLTQQSDTLDTSSRPSLRPLSLLLTPHTLTPILRLERLRRVILRQQPLLTHPMDIRGRDVAVLREVALSVVVEAGDRSVLALQLTRRRWGEYA